MPTPKNWVWPTESKTDVALHENTILQYGVPKIGKTTLASKFPDALFLLTEEGAKHLSIKAFHIKKWSDFLDRLKMIESAVQANEFPLKTIIIDTVDNLAEFCEEWVCAKNSINIIGDLDYGKGYSLYKKEFITNVRRITQLGLGLQFISHAEEKEVQVNAVTNPYAPLEADLRSGKVKMIIPTLEKRAYKFISGLVDMILYLEIDSNNNRVINTKPTKHFEAGDRSGRLPAVMPLDYSFLVKAYYGSENGEIPEQLLSRLNKAEQYLAEKKIDGFDVTTRVENSRRKHLKVNTFKEATIENLEKYLQHLRIKATNAKNGAKK